MKKLLALLLLFPSFSFGAITPAQVDQARLATNQMADTVADLRAFILMVRPLIQAGNTYQPEFSTNPVSLTAAQIQDIVNRYQALKTQLTTEFNQLP